MGFLTKNQDFFHFARGAHVNRQVVHITQLDRVNGHRFGIVDGDNIRATDRQVGRVESTGVVGFKGAGFFQVKAWKGANSFEAAAATNGAEVGMSNVIGLTPGDSTASPPGLPADLAGLEAFSLTVVPEPGTIALAVLGLAAFFVRRRK